MDTMPSALASAFRVDLWAVTWMGIAMVLVSSLSWHFYRGLETPRTRPLTPGSPAVTASSTYWVHMLAVWWALDTLWHARTCVVFPTFWQHWPKPALPFWPLAWHLWTQSPVDWDFLIILIDGGLAVGLWLTVRRPPQSLLFTAAVWGFIRWWLTGGTLDWLHATPIGPGGDLWAAMLALVANRSPRMVKMGMGGMASWLGAIALTTPHLSWAMRGALALGLWGIPLTEIWRWSRAGIMLWTAFMSAELMMLGIGVHFWNNGLNTLWPPFLGGIGMGLWVDSPLRHTAVPRHRTPDH
ncbi:MAG: hypothetical protein OWU84_14775 [Firmicutes bacterium]|nr:hypothetical protein [Bacillota bacterium]